MYLDRCHVYTVQRASSCLTCCSRRGISEGPICWLLLLLSCYSWLRPHRTCEWHIYPWLGKSSNVHVYLLQLYQELPCGSQGPRHTQQKSAWMSGLAKIWETFVLPCNSGSCRSCGCSLHPSQWWLHTASSGWRVIISFLNLWCHFLISHTFGHSLVLAEIQLLVSLQFEKISTTVNYTIYKQLKFWSAQRCLIQTLLNSFLVWAINSQLGSHVIPVVITLLNPLLDQVAPHRVMPVLTENNHVIGILLTMQGYSK